MQLKELKEITSQLDVLYVEDDFDLRSQNYELLSHLFNSITLADDGEMALKIYQEKSFDMVITDINIPKLNGISMIKKMKEKNSTQRFLITTVYKYSELESQLRELNIEYFLTKPINTKKLLKEIEKLVQELEAI